MQIEVAERFCGPRTSGNGGYTCGLIAETLDRTDDGIATNFAWSIKLRLPPPLNRPMRLASVAGSEYALWDADARIAEAHWQAMPELHMPRAVDAARAAAAEKSSLAGDGGRFGHCFVCGSQRGVGDGLRLFAGPVADASPREGGRLAAALWRPHASLLDNGRLARRFIWAALDCPGYFAVVEADEYLLLAQMTAVVHEQPPAGETLIVQSWPLPRAGRSRLAGTALFGTDGRLLARGHTRWLPPRESLAPPPPGADQLQCSQST